MKIRLTYAENQYCYSEAEINKRFFNWRRLKEQYEDLDIYGRIINDRVYFDIDEEYLLPFMSYFGSPVKMEELKY